MRDINISDEAQRAQWVETAGDVAFSALCFFGIASIFIVAGVVCGFIWLVVAQ